MEGAAAGSVTALPVVSASSSTAGLWLAFAASAANNIGKALQKRGTDDLPRISLERKVLLAYARHPTWRVGFTADLGGAVLMLMALQMAPLSLVQPIAGSGMAVLALFSHYYLREELRALEWLGVAVAATGAMGVGAVGGGGGGSGPSSNGAPALLEASAPAALLLCAMVGALGGLEVIARAAQLRDKRLASPLPLYELSARGHALHELATGVQGGLLFGLSSAASRTALLLSAQLRLPALVPLGVCASIVLSACGFLCQARGLKDGRAVVVCTYAAIATIASGVLVGVFALAEPLPEGPAALLAWWLSLGAIVAGVSLLVQRGAGAGAAGGAAGKNSV
jgi:multidrug transporter EmrE-like cation transporter